jgi:hypothetical protein
MVIGDGRKRETLYLQKKGNNLFAEKNLCAQYPDVGLI